MKIGISGKECSIKLDTFLYYNIPPSTVLHFFKYGIHHLDNIIEMTRKEVYPSTIEKYLSMIQQENERNTGDGYTIPIRAIEEFNKTFSSDDSHLITQIKYIVENPELLTQFKEYWIIGAKDYYKIKFFMENNISPKILKTFLDFGFCEYYVEEFLRTYRDGRPLSEILEYINGVVDLGFEYTNEFYHCIISKIPVSIMKECLQNNVCNYNLMKLFRYDPQTYNLSKIKEFLDIKVDSCHDIQRYIDVNVGGSDIQKYIDFGVTDYSQILHYVVHGITLDILNEYPEDETINWHKVLN